MPMPPTYYRVSVLYAGRRYRILDTLYLEEAVARVTGGDPRWPYGLVNGAVITDDMGHVLDPRMYASRVPVKDRFGG